MCPFVSADVRGGGRLRDEPKECLRRRLVNPLQNATFGWVAPYCQGIKSHQARVALYLYCNFHYQ